VVLCAVSVLLLGACSTSSEYRPVDFDAIYKRPAAVVAATRSGAIGEDVHEEVLRQAERTLSETPHLSRVVTRAEVEQALQGDPELRTAYDRFSDTFSVAGFADRDLSRKLAAALDVEVLILVQVYHTPCSTCQGGDQLAAVGAVVEAESARLLWRYHLMENVGQPDAEAVAQGVHELADELLTALNNTIRPKWHRMRFEKLAGRGLS